MKIGDLLALKMYPYTVKKCFTFCLDCADTQPDMSLFAYTCTKRHLSTPGDSF